MKKKSKTEKKKKKYVKGSIDSDLKWVKDRYCQVAVKYTKPANRKRCDRPEIWDPILKLHTKYLVAVIYIR